PQQQQSPSQLQQGQQSGTQQFSSRQSQSGQAPVSPTLQQSQQQQQSGQSQTSPGTSSPFTPIGNAGTSPVAGGGIVGVASDSDETSLMVYNQRQKYSD